MGKGLRRNSGPSLLRGYQSFGWTVYVRSCTFTPVSIEKTTWSECWSSAYMDTAELHLRLTLQCTAWSMHLMSTIFIQIQELLLPQRKMAQS